MRSVDFLIRLSDSSINLQASLLQICHRPPATAASAVLAAGGAWRAVSWLSQAGLSSSWSIDPPPEARFPCTLSALWTRPYNYLVPESVIDLGSDVAERAHGSSSEHSAPNITLYCPRQTQYFGCEAKTVLRRCLHLLGLPCAPSAASLQMEKLMMIWGHCYQRPGSQCATSS